MLLDQAHALQAVFTNLANRAQGARYLTQHQTYMLLALKAQNQCRQTLAALAEIKNPRRATFIGQQNNATNQQVNNAGGPSGIRKNPQTRENELLEVKPHEGLDTGTPGAAIGADRAVETVGALNRS